MHFWKSIVTSVVFAGLALSSVDAVVAPASSETATLESLESAWAFAEASDPALKALEAEASAAQAAQGVERALPNPELEASSKYGGGETFGKNWEVGLLVDVGGLMSSPWRFEEAESRARSGMARIDAARAARRFEVASAWFQAVTARAARDLEAAAASAWNVEAELARRRREAGTLNALDLAESEAAAAQARLAARRAEREATEATVTLARVLGLPAESTAGGWKLPASLSEPPSVEPPLAVWMQAARTGSPTLAAGRAEADAARRARTRATLASLPGLKAGATVEHGAGGTSIGPKVAVEVPLFDLGFSRRTAARALSDAAAHRAAAEETDVLAHIATRHAAMLEAREAHTAWRDTVLPLRERASAEALRHYNFMLVGVDRLLAARREELSAGRARIEALRDYWTARAALEELVGRTLPARTTSDKGDADEDNPTEGGPTPTTPTSLSEPAERPETHTH